MEKIIYRVGICDDEQRTCMELKSHIEKLFEGRQSGLEVYIWYNGETFCTDLKKDCELREINTLLLDIELPGKNGVEVGHFIREEMNDSAMNIVYISSKTNYAMELFQVHPFDFVTKPFDYGYLDKMFEKLLFWDEQDRRHYHYVAKKTLHKLPFGKILYIRSDNKHLLIHMSDGNIVEFTGKLKNEAAKFPISFVQISKSYIINMKYIDQCRIDSVTMSDHTVISVTRPYRQFFKDRLSKYNLEE